MARDSFSPVAATEVRSIQVTLTVTAGSPNIYAARYSFEQLGSDGNAVQERTGNLIPYLTGPQITSARALMDAMLIKAQASV